MRFGPRAATVFVALACAACKKGAPSVDGAELYASSCARCHGQYGAGTPQGFVGGGLPPARNFRDHEFQKSRTDEQITTTIRRGKGSGMPAFGTAFDDAQLRALVSQVRSFDPEKK